MLLIFYPTLPLLHGSSLTGVRGRRVARRKDQRRRPHRPPIRGGGGAKNIACEGKDVNLKIYEPPEHDEAIFSPKHES